MFVPKLVLDGVVGVVKLNLNQKASISNKN